MGTLTADELKDELSSWLGSRDDITDARLFRFLNLAQHRLARVRSFEELEKLDTSIQFQDNSLDSDRFITLPSDIKKIRSWVVLDGNNSLKLTFYPARQWDKVQPKPEQDARGRPSIYTKFQNKAEIWQLPDATYSTRLRYSAWPAALSAGGSASDFDHKDDILLNLAMVIAYTAVANMEKASEFWKIYRSLLNDAIGEDLEKPDMELIPDAMHGINYPTPDEYWKDPFYKG